MRPPEYDREMRAIRTAVLADRAEFVTCLVLAFTVVALVIVPVAYLLHGMLAHLAVALPR